MLLSNGDNEKMAKGLDIGTMNIICSKLEGEREVFTQQRNAFLELDSSDLTKSMLDSHFRKLKDAAKPKLADLISESI